MSDVNQELIARLERDMVGQGVDLEYAEAENKKLKKDNELLRGILKDMVNVVDEDLVCDSDSAYAEKVFNEAHKALEATKGERS